MLTHVFLNIFLLFAAFNTVMAGMPEMPCDSICKNGVLNKNGENCVVLDNTIQMYYKTLGKGSPTIIFSSGTGFPAIGWYDTKIATEMSKRTKVVAYDRIYTYNSCPNYNNFMPVTAQDVVDNLKNLLIHEHIAPPYILVGQSFGGLYMQLYAREYPNEVKGLVLIDSVTSDGPVKLTKEEEEFLLMNHLDHPQKPSPTNPLYNEIMGQLPSYLQLQKAQPLPKTMPIIVMYATKECLPKINDQQLCMDKKRMQEHFKQQLRLYNMTTNHKLVKVEGEHMSFFDPDKRSLVISELNSMLDMVQDAKDNSGSVTEK